MTCAGIWYGVLAPRGPSSGRSSKVLLREMNDSSRFCVNYSRHEPVWLFDSLPALVGVLAKVLPRTVNTELIQLILS